MPLLPAQLGVLSPTRARLTLHEGRYHQVRRMFAAVGNHVEALHRSGVGGLDLGELTEGEWRMLAATDVARLFHTDSARPRRSASRPRRFEDPKPSGTYHRPTPRPCKSRITRALLPLAPPSEDLT